MHPDLVGAAGLELAGQKRRNRLAVAPIEGFLDFPVGNGLAAALDRQALHAYLLVLQHPRSGEILHWESRLPEDLLLLQNTLRAAL